MALPTDHLFEATPAYVVYRDLQPGESLDPTSPLLFFPPKGSDELFDALRIAFPHLKTHSERMRDAIIQFLLDERQEEQLQASPALTMDTAAPTWPSMSSSGSASVFSSPDLLDLPTPASFANSPQAQTPQLARQASTATSSQTSPPSLDQMTGVFSLSAEAQPKQRVRRKMTEAEKVEYRKRRIVKACDKCAKRKRKCPHNQAQMEVAPMSKSVAKSGKPVSHKTRKTAEQVANVEDLASVEQFTENFEFTSGLDMNSFQSFDDFPMFEDAFPEFTVDDLMYFDQPGANFQPQNYFAPDISPPQQSRSSGSVNHNLDQPQPHIPTQHVPGGTSRLQIPVIDGKHKLESHARSTELDTQYQSRRSGMRVSTEAETRNDVPLGVGQEQAGSPRQGDQHNGDQSIHGNGIPWQRLRSVQQGAAQPTHTAHVHQAECGEISGLAQAHGVLEESRLTSTLPHTTLRLVGTTKAVRAFAGLARSSHSSPSRQQSVSMSRVVDALGRVTEHGPSTLDGCVQTHPPIQYTHPQSSTPALSSSALRKLSNRIATAVQHNGHTVCASTGAGKQELELQTSTSVSQPSALRIGSAALNQGRPPSQSLSIGQNHATQRRLLSSSSISGNVPLQTQRIASASKEEGIANHNRNTNSPTLIRTLFGTTLGEGAANLDSMSTELYMLRRRIPRKPGTNQNHQHTTNANNYQDVQVCAQANGGAYQRLQPRDAHAAANGSGRTPAIALTPVSIVGTHAVKDATAISASAFTYQSDLHGRAGKAPQQDRLRDYFKVRDHHGRSSSGTAAAFLAAVLVLGAILFAGALPTVVACYAAWYSCFSLEKEGPVQCSEKNSSWLVNVLHKKMELPAQKKCTDEVVGASTANEAWLKGLMYPFAYSPLRFVAMV